MELVIFTSEEPTRFGIGCLGSRLLAGLIDPQTVGARTGRDGVSLDDARRAAGFTGPLESAPLPAGFYSAFVELHIEQ
jgi:N-carbamoyl-L-amino-acid hydrolase